MVMATLVPTKVLSRVDLPTFDRPIIVTNPLLCVDMGSSFSYTVAELGWNEKFGILEVCCDFIR